MGSYLSIKEKASSVYIGKHGEETLSRGFANPVEQDRGGIKGRTILQKKVQEYLDQGKMVIINDQMASDAEVLKRFKLERQVSDGRETFSIVGLIIEREKTLYARPVGLRRRGSFYGESDFERLTGTSVSSLVDQEHKGAEEQDVVISSEAWTKIIEGQRIEQAGKARDSLTV